jgi:hypothetical protein
MKFLNLDDIALNSERTVKYQGVTYNVRDFNVEEFIQFQKHFTAFKAAYNSQSDEDMPKVITATQELVKLGIPDFPVDQVPKFNPVQMLAVVSMIANLIPEADEETTEAAAKDPKAESPEA